MALISGFLLLPKKRHLNRVSRKVCLCTFYSRCNREHAAMFTFFEWDVLAVLRCAFCLPQVMSVHTWWVLNNSQCLLKFKYLENGFSYEIVKKILLKTFVPSPVGIWYIHLNPHCYKMKEKRYLSSENLSPWKKKVTHFHNYKLWYWC